MQRAIQVVDAGLAGGSAIAAGMYAGDGEAASSEFGRLVFHESDEGADNERGAAASDAGELLAERLSCACGHDQEDVAAIANVKKAGIPVVVVVVSGRPLVLGDSADAASAIVAAWLPGSEGDGVADVLFGDFKPTGKLSFTWPRSMDQLPLHTGGQPLFEYGFGLSY